MTRIRASATARAFKAAPPEQARTEFAAALAQRLGDIRDTLGRLELSFRSEDAEMLYRAAHALRDGADRAGAQALRERSAGLETLARSWIARAQSTDRERRHAQEILARIEALALAYEARQDGLARSPATRLGVVGEISSLVHAASDLREIFSSAIVKVQRALEFRRASVVLANESGTHYSLHTLYDTARGGVIEHRAVFPIDAGVTGEVLRSGKPTRVDAMPGTSGILLEEGKRVSALIVPLRVNDRVIGTLNFGHETAGAYTDEDLEWAGVVARQIESSLYYSRLLSAMAGQRNQLEALMEASDAAVMLVSADRRVAHVNAAMAGLLGIPREALLGASLDGMHRFFARAFAVPGALELQEQALTDDVTLRDRVELTFPRPGVYQRLVAPVRGSTDGTFFGRIVLYRDVTHEVEVERAKSEFVSTVSHELRTPMASVSTSLSLLLSGAGGALSDPARELLDIAHRNTDRLIRLVNDLLDLSRLEAGRLELELAPVPLADAIRSSADAVASFAREEDVRIALTPPTAPLAVLGMRDRVEQVFVNLLGNAIKFSPRGAVVTVSWRDDGDAAVIEVADQGPGIPAEQLEMIFEPFRQLDSSSTREHGGAGLGLTISRDIVRAHGGKLWAESEPGSGARFFVRLLLAPHPSTGTALVHVGPAPEVRQPFVLVVHSDRDWQRLAQARAGVEGWRVAAADTGSGALELLRRERADLVILALELSDMHGLDVLQQIQLDAALFDTPVVLAAEGDVRSVTEEGGDGSGIAMTAEDVVERARRLLTEPPRRVVLVVEDDPLLRPALGKIVRRAGYACLTVANGRDALEFTRTRVPDLVITDFRMPEMNGITFLEELRRLPNARRTRAIMLTGHMTPELVRQVSDLSAKVLSKPVEATELVATIKEML